MPLWRNGRRARTQNRVPSPECPFESDQGHHHPHPCQLTHARPPAKGRKRRGSARNGCCPRTLRSSSCAAARAAASRTSPATPCRSRCCAIGDKPILWHIMKIYEAHGFSNFILALGHLGWEIKDYFLNERLMDCDFRLEVDGDQQRTELLCEPARTRRSIIFADTGEATQTGERIARCRKYVTGGPFHGHLRRRGRRRGRRGARPVRARPGQDRDRDQRHSGRPRSATSRSRTGP